MENHPSKKIIGEISKELFGKKIVLGVTSSVSLYKSIDLARSLMKNGAEITTVMSSEAARLVSPELFEWATGNKVYVGRFGGEVGHVSLSETHDAMVIAPATANTISKLAYGIADTAVTLVAIAFMGGGKPLFLVPAMHKQLYEAPQTREALMRLDKMNVVVHEPLMEGDKAKFPEVWELEWHIEALLTRKKDLKGLKVLVSAGPTREYIDSVRYISNPSSGKMGGSVANEAFFRGARVSIVHGPIFSVPISQHISRTAVETTEEMLNAMVVEMKTFEPDLIIMAAAPVDFRPTNFSKDKLSSDSPLTLSLEPTPKILKEIVKRKKNNSIVISFAAETADSEEELITKAKLKLEKYGADIVVANNVRRKDIGFSSEYNEVTILAKDGKIEKVPKSDKKIVARRILDFAKQYIGK